MRHIHEQHISAQTRPLRCSSAAHILILNRTVVYQLQSGLQSCYGHSCPCTLAPGLLLSLIVWLSEPRSLKVYLVLLAEGYVVAVQVCLFRQYRFRVNPVSLSIPLDIRCERGSLGEIIPTPLIETCK